MRATSLVRIGSVGLALAAGAIVGHTVGYVLRHSMPVDLPPLTAPEEPTAPRELDLTLGSVSAWAPPGSTDGPRPCAGRTRCFELCRSPVWPDPPPARIVPVFRDGRAEGIRLASALPGVLESVGLSRHDVIRGADELGFDKLDHLTVAQDRYDRGHAVTLHVARGAETFDLTLRSVPCPR